MLYKLLEAMPNTFNMTCTIASGLVAFFCVKSISTTSLLYYSHDDKYNSKVLRMARDYRMVVRLTDKERKKVEAQARKLGVSMSEIVQDWIKTLPDPETDGN